MINEIIVALGITILKFLYTIFIYKKLPFGNWDKTNKLLTFHTVIKNIILIIITLLIIFLTELNSFTFFVYFMIFYFITVITEIIILQKIRKNKG